MLCDKVFQAFLGLLLMLTVIGWPVAAVWAVLVVNSHLADKRNERLIRAMRERN